MPHNAMQVRQIQARGTAGKPRSASVALAAQDTNHVAGPRPSHEVLSQRLSGGNPGCLGASRAAPSPRQRTGHEMHSMFEVGKVQPVRTMH